jgi:hypothetical protein
MEPIYPVLRRVQIKKEECPSRVGRIATDCFLVNKDKEVMSFGRVIHNPIDPDDKHQAYCRSIGRAIEALLGNKDTDKHGLPIVRRYSPIPLHADKGLAVQFLDDKTKKKIEKLDITKRKPLELFKSKNGK